MRWSRVWSLSPLVMAAGLGAVGALAVPAGVWAAALITSAAAGALAGSCWPDTSGTPRVICGWFLRWRPAPPPQRSWRSAS